MEAPSFTFLPPPRMPLVENGSEPPPGLHALIDAHRERMRALRAEVGGAVQLLYDGRPGGAAWKAAQDADTDVILSGKPLKAPALAKLLEGDYGRWAVASAQCRTAVKRAAAILAGLKGDAATISADLAADRARLIAERRPMLADLWQTAQGTSRGQALVAIETLTPLNTRIALLGQIGLWLTHPGAGPLKTYAGSEFPFVESDPAARRDRGYWLASQVVTGALLTRIPNADEVTWPDGFSDGERVRMPNSVQFGAIDRARRGEHGAVFAPDLPESARRIGSLGLGSAPVGAQRPRRGR